MKSRREFLKGAATGAVLLGTASAAEKLVLAGAPVGKSKVVVARDASLHVAGAEPDEQKVQNLLDKAMAVYTGREKPVSAWKSVIPANILAGQTVGLKVNGLGGRGIATHPALILAVAERLQQVGVKPGNIVVWDQNAHFLEACGMKINTDPSRIRSYPADSAGFDEDESSWGVAKIRLTRILTRDCAMVINLPILKDHELAGVTFSMKNMYGVVDKPFLLHANGCNPGVADLNCIPTIREKVRLTIGDAISSVYDGGPGFHPERLWYPSALVVGEDRVAVDQTAWEMIESQRKAVGMPSLEAVGRKPNYIATAADAAHGLGTCDPARIRLVEV